MDTGKISGTGELRVDYNGFLTGNAYSIQCTVETANGVSVTTGWVDFNVSYTVSETTGNVTACQLSNEPCVYVKWTPDVLAQGYTVLRRTVGDTKLKKLAYGAVPFAARCAVGRIRKDHIHAPGGKLL